MALCSRWFMASVLGCLQLLMLYSPALARVYISDQVKFSLPIEQYIKIRPGQSVRLPLPVNAPALLDVAISVQNATFNDLNVYVCDESSLQRFAQRLANNCRGIKKGRGNFSFRYTLQSPQKHYLVLDNSYALMIIKTVTVQVTATVQLSPADVNQLRARFETFQTGIFKMFSVPEFDLTLAPCGRSNAFSTGRGGNITICSELYFELIANNLKGALEAVILHELAHTLLNLWGLPNWDNEETADELALVILFWSGRQQSALDWMQYFSTQDSQTQASNQLRYGDRHPLSIQRVRNIKRVLRNPRPVVQRWNRLIYPHLSEKGLKGVVDNPGPYGDRGLARQELDTRAQ